MGQRAIDPDDCTAHFNRIYDETYPDLEKYIAVKCSDPSYIGDILQKTYCEYYKLLLKRGTDYLKSDRAALKKIAKRCVYSYYSLKQKLSRVIPLFNSNRDGEEYCTVNDCQSESEEDKILSDMEAERIWGIINTYPAETRKIFYLYFNEGMSHSQIAKALNCSLHSVKNKLYRNLKELKEKENGYER